MLKADRDRLRDFFEAPNLDSGHSTPLRTATLEPYRTRFLIGFRRREFPRETYATAHPAGMVEPSCDNQRHQVSPLHHNHREKQVINWTKLWNLRHEPVSVLVSIAVLLLAVTTIYLTVNQVIFRNAPIICGSQYFPAQKEDCKDIQESRADETQDIPIGTIVAFFGRDSDIPDGWILCDGRDNPANSLVSIDANAEKGGIQLPDLRGKFVRGTETSLDGVQLLTGGEDGISFNHSHIWTEFQSRRWYSYNAEGNRFRVDDWDNGIGNKGDGNYPLLTKGARNAKLYTRASDQTIDNRPAYAELQYIVRIF